MAFMLALLDYVAVAEAIAWARRLFKRGTR